VADGLCHLSGFFGRIAGIRFALGRLGNFGGRMVGGTVNSGAPVPCIGPMGLSGVRGLGTFGGGIGFIPNPAAASAARSAAASFTSSSANPCSNGSTAQSYTNQRRCELSTDIRTQEGWNRFLDRLGEYMSERAQDSEAEITECNLILTANPETGEALGKPGVYTLMTRFHGSDDECEYQKEHYATILRLISIAGCCIGSVFLSEAWMSCYTADEKEALENRPQPKDDPRRKEALIMMVDHKTFGPAMRHAFIDEVNGKRQLQEWVTDHGYTAGGRFSSFVPPDQVISKPDIVKMARIFAMAEKVIGGIIPIDELLKEERRAPEANHRPS